MHSAFSIKPQLIIGVLFFTIALIVAILHIVFEHLETNSKRMVEREQFSAVSLLMNENDYRLINAPEQLIILPKQLPRTALSNPAKAVLCLIYSSLRLILHGLKKHIPIAGVSVGTGFLLVMDDGLAALRWYAEPTETGQLFDPFINASYHSGWYGRHGSNTTSERN